MRKNSVRKLRMTFIVMVAVVAIASLLIFGQRWKAVSQGSEMPTVTTYIYPTYEHNNLNGPTGLWIVHPNRPDMGAQYFHLFIADTGNHVIRQFTSIIGSADPIAGTMLTPGYVDGSNALFRHPTGISGKSTTWSECTGVHRDTCTYYDYQNIYINDTRNFAVRKVCVGSQNPSNSGDCNYDVQTASHPVQTATGKGYAGYVNGLNSVAEFSALAGTSAGTTTSYLVDSGNNAIRAWDGVSVSTFAGDGTAGFADGYRTAAKFNVPTKTCKDTAGNMFISDSGNNAIRKIDTQGYVTTLAGGGPTAPGKVDGPGASARFFRPTAVVYNPADGYTYVADSHNNSIRRIDAAGNVTTYAGTGEPGLVNGPIAQAKFSMPADLVIYNGFMYISDNQNNVIRAIDMVNGIVSTFIS